jgi:FAD/FMN-containing dehydrogenase
MADTIAALIAALGPEAVMTGDAVSARASGFLDSSPLRAKAIIRPTTTAQVAEALRLCHAVGQTVVPHGGLTNLVYNTRTTEDDIALSLERMTSIEAIDPIGWTMTVQAGATLHSVQEAAAAVDLLFPLDLAARGSCTIGGNIANNAGGTRVIRYGMMRDLVLGLEAVLADGTIVSSLNRMLKNNAGYDLKQLFIGSEGTLGIVTRAVLRLWPQPRSVATALVSMSRFDQVTGLLSLAQRELGSLLTSYEVMWQAYYRLTTTPPAASSAPLRDNAAFYTLIETLGADPDRDTAQFNRMLDLAFEQGLFADAVIAKSSEQRRALWRIREDSEQIEAQQHPTFSFDISLPIGAMEQYVIDVQHALEAAFGAIKFWVYGHVGDGNLHLSVWGARIAKEEADRVAAIVYRPLTPLAGSISAEHGIGLEKKSFLALSRTADEIDLMRRIKRALDPKGILNPGKIFDLV